jgi:hypothetical protein
MTELPVCVKLAKRNESGAFLPAFTSDSILAQAIFARRRRTDGAHISDAIVRNPCRREGSVNKTPSKRAQMRPFAPKSALTDVTCQMTSREPISGAKRARGEFFVSLLTFCFRLRKTHPCGTGVGWVQPTDICWDDCGGFHPPYVSTLEQKKTKATKVGSEED